MISTEEQADHAQRLQDRHYEMLAAFRRYEEEFSRFRGPDAILVRELLGVASHTLNRIGGMNLMRIAETNTPIGPVRTPES